MKEQKSKKQKQLFVTQNKFILTQKLMQPQHQKLAMFVLFLAIISVVIYTVLKSKKDKPNPTNVNFNANVGSGNTTGNGNTTGSGGSNPSASNATFPLKKGMKKNDYVKALQKGINRRYFAKLSEDGIYGSKTQVAVQRYLDPVTTKQGKAKPSQVGVWWGLFQALGFEKYV